MFFDNNFDFFNKFGGLVPIINLFGGKNKYLNVISNIERALYS